MSEIDWPAATILDRESDKSTRSMNEAVHNAERETTMLELGRGQLHAKPHVRPISCTSHLCRGKNWTKNWTSFFWWRSLAQTETSR